MTSETSEIVRDDALLGELRVLIERARERVAVAVNRELVLLYWDLGQRVRVEILGEERAVVEKLGNHRQGNHKGCPYAWC